MTYPTVVASEESSTGAKATGEESVRASSEKTASELQPVQVKITTSQRTHSGRSTVPSLEDKSK